MSLRSIFARHRHRFLSPEERAHRVQKAVAALDADPLDASAVERRGSPREVATALLAHAPYDPELRRGLARHAARCGDEEALCEHLEAAFDPEGADLETLRGDLDGLVPDLEARLDGLVQGWGRRARVKDMAVESVGPGETALVWPVSAHDAVVRVYEGWLAHVGRVEAKIFDEPRYVEWAVADSLDLESPFDLEPPLDRSFGHLGAILRLFDEVAPHVEDLRLHLYDQTSELHEIWIVDGVCYALEHPCEGFDTEASTLLLGRILAEVGEDPPLRQVVVSGWRTCAGWAIRALREHPERRAEAEAHLERLRAYGDRALVLRALLHDGLDEPELAREALRRALLVSRGWREGWLLLASRLLDVGAFEEGFAAAHEATRVAYYCDKSRLLCAVAKAALGEGLAAQGWIQAHIERYGTAYPGALLREAGELLEAHHVDLATTCATWLVEQPRYKTRGEELLQRCRLRRDEGSLEDALAELVARPGDLGLRSEVASRLVRVGHPSGLWIRAQLGHDLAETFAERERAASILGGLSPAIAVEGLRLEWARGFVRVAELVDGGAAQVEALLADPAGRLLEELIVLATDAAPDGATGGALAGVIRGRPRPSALRRVYVIVGESAAARRSGEEASAPRGLDLDLDLALDVPIVPWRGPSPAAIHRGLCGGEGPEFREELRIRQIEPRTPERDYQVVLPLLPGALEPALRVIDGWSERVRGMLDLDDAGEQLVFYQVGDRCYAGIGNLLRAFDAIAPFVDDVRFAFWDSDSELLYEVRVTQGRLSVIAGEIDEDDHELRRAWFAQRSRQRPEDYALRRMVVDLILDDADFYLRRAGDGGLARAQERLAEAAGLECFDPALHLLQARCAERSGDTLAAEEAYLRAAEVQGQACLPATLAALAGGRDDAARRHLASFRAAWPEHTLGRWIDAYLQDDPSLLGGLLRVVAERSERPEPDLVELASSPRFAAMSSWLIDALPPAGEAACRYLVAVAGRLRGISASLADKAFEAAILRAPADPKPWLAWAQTDDPELRLARLRRARALAPDDLDVLSALGRGLTESEDWPRVIEVLSHRQALVEASGEKPRGYGWHLDLVRLYTACYQGACSALYGRPAGASRPPGRPADDALDRCDVLLDQGLAAVRAWTEEDTAAHGAFYTVKAIVASFRKDNAAATAWSTRSIAAAPTPHGYSTRASARNNHGDLDGAEEDARAALELDPEHHHADYVLACVGAKRGRPFERLLPHLQRIAELWPEGRSEVLEEKDLAPLRDHPVFRRLFAGGVAT